MGACEGWHPDEDPGEDWQPRESPREDWRGEKRDPPKTGWSALLWWSLTDPFLRSCIVTVVARRLLRRGPKSAGKQIFGE